jgi:C4-dicarboxylate-specific signal transduction histidine kinase
VQLQQVILTINAVEAMSTMRDGSRELLICTEKAESNSALVAVRDSDPRLTPKSVNRLFEAFYNQRVNSNDVHDPCNVDG